MSFWERWLPAGIWLCAAFLAAFIVVVALDAAANHELAGAMSRLNEGYELCQKLRGR